MPRLSVSFEGAQSDWIADTAAEMGISKGKVVRECVDQIRTGDSMFTSPVTEATGDTESRLTAVESRLETLEAIVKNSIATPQTGTEISHREEADGTADAQDRPTIPQESGGSSRDTGTESTEPSQESREEMADESTADPTTAATPTTDRGGGNAPMADSGGKSTARSTPSPEATQARQEAPTDSAAEQDDATEAPIETTEPEAIEAHLQSTLDEEAHSDAVFACWELLHNRGTVHVRAFKELFDEYPIGHEEVDVWWGEDIQPVLDSLPGVTPPEGRGNFYRFKY